jgi:adenosine deaminase
MTDNFLAVAEAHSMSTREIARFTFNAINASFISKHEKQRLEAMVNEELGLTL